MSPVPTPRAATFLGLAVLLACGGARAEGDAEILDRVMREIGIQYLISDDRKIPKSDHAAWEASLEPVVDFGALNAAMTARIERALAGMETPELPESDEEIRDQMARKAIAFLVPRQLPDYMVAYLKKRDEGGPIVACETEPIPDDGEDYVICLERVSRKEKHVRFIAPGNDELSSLVFTKGERWRLSDIRAPVDERTLMAIAMWK